MSTAHPEASLDKAETKTNRIVILVALVTMPIELSSPHQCVNVGEFALNCGRDELGRQVEQPHVPIDLIHHQTDRAERAKHRIQVIGVTATAKPKILSGILHARHV